MKYNGQDKEGRLIIDGEGETIYLEREMFENGFLFTNFIFDSSGIKISEEELIERKFKELKEKWEKETCFLSDPTLIFGNSNYKEIIKIGKKVIPFILEDLKNKPNFWMNALEEISGEDILQKESGYDGYIKNAI
ncbi:MAG TPA: hypothetical protein VMZ91_08775, partial [Candidatus Paceibacterota bacterium]|nr:hypothetical protein [Candidatus Paceibacterota bacterium]